MTRQLSQHTIRELENAIMVGHKPGDPPPLERDASVPGCPCPVCIVATIVPDKDVRPIALELVNDLARLAPVDRRTAAREASSDWAVDGIMLPTADTLAAIAARVEGARRSTPERTDNPLPVEAARRASILEVCERHGIDLKRVGSSYRAPCPIHEGAKGLNFSVSPELDLFHCFVCNEGGDAIALEQALSGRTFVESVLVLA